VKTKVDSPVARSSSDLHMKSIVEALLAMFLLEECLSTYKEIVTPYADRMSEQAAITDNMK
jgi:hypothetical protein